MKRLLSVIITLFISCQLAQAQFSGPSNTRVTIRETSKTLPLGLWSIGTLGDSFKIEKNTSATGNFGTTVSVFSASGAAVTVAAPNGAWSFTYPTTNGTNNFLLSTNGSGVTSWVAPPSGISGLTTGRVTFAASATTLTDDADLTFATDTLTSTKLGVTTSVAIGTSTLSGALNVVGNAIVSGKIGVGAATSGGDIEIIKNNSGGFVYGSSINTSNTANSHAQYFIQVAGSSAGNPSIYFNISGLSNWSTGIDNSDSDKFKISNSAALGTSDRLIIDSSGFLLPGSDNTQQLGTAAVRWSTLHSYTLNTSALNVVTGGSLVDASITVRASEGLVIQGKAGGTSDFSLFSSSSAALVMSNPVGTANSQFGGIIQPATDNSKDVGASGLRWRVGYFGTSLGASGTRVPTTFLNKADISATGADYAIRATSAQATYIAYFDNQASAGNSLGILIQAGTNSTDYAIRTQSKASAELFNVRGDGHIFMPSITTSAAATAADACFTTGGEIVNDSALCVVSARRFKRDIQPIDIGTDFIKQLRPVRYYLKEPAVPDQSKEMFGLIAEDVELLDDRLVSHQEDGQVRSVFYIQLVPVLIKGIQELEQRISILEAR